MKMKGVLLYNIPKDKLKRIRVLLVRMGLEGRTVKPEEYSLPVGALAGQTEPAAPLVPEAEALGFTDEMLVLCGLSSPQLSAFLDALRQNRCGVALKAVLTETNAAWSSLALHRELLAERAALEKARGGAGGKSVHRPS